MTSIFHLQTPKNWLKRHSSRLRALGASILSLGLIGCDPGYRFLPGAGPSALRLASFEGLGGIVVSDLTLANVSDAQISSDGMTLRSLPLPRSYDPRLSIGDQIEVILIEAAPPFLLGSSPLGDSMGQTRTLAIPAQMIGPSGQIAVPFVGEVQAAGRTVSELRMAIELALVGRANQAQAIVRAVEVGGQEVAVVGEVKQPRRLPLSARSLRVLDALAAAGGTTGPLDKVVVAITRQGVTAQAPLSSVIRVPEENVVLAAGDVIAVYHKAQHFVVLGAVAQPGEVPFEATGITLAQGLARAGGLVETRSSPRAVYLARPDPGRPKLWRIDLSDPQGLFLMSRVPVQSGDIVYVATADAVELQKFLALVGSVFGTATSPLGMVR